MTTRTKVLQEAARLRLAVLGNMEGLMVTWAFIRCIVQGRWLAPPSALETLDNLVEGVMAPFWRHY